MEGVKTQLVPFHLVHRGRTADDLGSQPLPYSNGMIKTPLYLTLPYPFKEGTVDNVRYHSPVVLMVTLKKLFLLTLMQFCYEGLMTTMGVIPL